MTEPVKNRREKDHVAILTRLLTERDERERRIQAERARAQAQHSRPHSTEYAYPAPAPSVPVRTQGAPAGTSRALPGGARSYTPPPGHRAVPEGAGIRIVPDEQTLLQRLLQLLQ